MFSIDATKEIFVLCCLSLIFPFLCAFLTIYGLIELILNRNNFKSISGEIAVVTGGGHGLGQCIALELASKGCHIAIADINLTTAKETVELITSQYNVKCKAYEVDVSNFEQVADLNKQITADLGPATILINNAGLLTLKNFAKPKFEEIQRMINVNLTAHFVTNSIFLENMKLQRKGHIVAISSIIGLFPLLYNSAYCATKFGVRGLMRSLRLDLQADGFKDIKTTIAYPTFLSTNNEVVHYTQECRLNKFYPLLSGEKAARMIVNAMLRNEVEISVPRGFGVLSRIFDFFPGKYQDVIWMVITNPFIKHFQRVFKQQKDEK